ncbi:MAG: IPT/TIG domain-containing protein, partial [Planctomycetes bacterium]|nr:IPT/TIG domain-containing protein [Planctomycetota bacterium]
GGAVNTLAIEFDNFVDAPGDAGLTEISIHTNGTSPVPTDETFSIARVLSPINFADGASHAARVKLAGGILEVFVDGLLQVSALYDYSLGANFLSGAGVGAIPLISGANASIGFTATTSTDAAGLVHHQDLRLDSWTFVSIAQLDPCFAGNVGGFVPGTTVDVLSVNGSAGGPFRTVTAFTDVPITFGLAQPPGNPAPALATIFGFLGVSSPSLVTPTPFGSFCFPTPLHAPGPFVSVLMDTSMNSASLPGLLPGSPTPWLFTVRPGIAFPFRFTIQGAVRLNNADPTSIAITNAVVVRVVVGPPPVIQSINPFLPAAGETVTLTGLNFRLGAMLAIAGMTVPLNVVSTTTATFINPGLPGCAQPLVLTNPDGQSSGVVLAPAPQVFQFPGAQGPAAGGGTFAITGTAFAAGSMTVTFGGVAATVTSSTSTSVIGIVPSGVAGTVVPVVLTRPDGCSVATTYSYL